MLLSVVAHAAARNTAIVFHAGRIVGVHRMPFFFSFLRAALSKTPHSKSASETFMKLNLELLPLLHNLEVSHRFFESACQGSHLLEVSAEHCDCDNVHACKTHHIMCVSLCTHPQDNKVLLCQNLDLTTPITTAERTQAPSLWTLVPGVCCEVAVIC